MPAALRFPRLAGRRLAVNVVSETQLYGLENQGGHTGFLDCVDLMRGHPDLDVRVNSRRRHDVVHSHSWGPAYFFWGRRMRGRRVFTAHVVPQTAIGTLPFADVGYPVVRGWMRAIFGYSDVVVSVAPKMTEQIRELGVRSRIETVPNPLRAERFFPSPELRAEGRRLLGITDDRPVVLGVGQIQPRKGIADFAAVAERIPHARFVWAGGRPFGVVSAGLAELDRLMRSPPPNLAFAGMFDLSLMPAVHNAADVMLFPSFQENCPYAPMEAASCGVPVVFRDIPEYHPLYALPWLRATDADGFARIVADLLASPDERARWSAIGIEQARRFEVPAYVDAIARIYDELACRAAGYPPTDP